MGIFHAYAAGDALCHTLQSVMIFDSDIVTYHGIVFVRCYLSGDTYWPQHNIILKHRHLQLVCEHIVETYSRNLQYEDLIIHGRSKSKSSSSSASIALYSIRPIKTCVCVYKRICVHIYLCVNTCIYIQMHTHTHTLAHTHTHTNTRCTRTHILYTPNPQADNWDAGLYIRVRTVA